MNLIISIITVFHLLRIIKKKYPLRLKSKILIFLGICLPIMDYIIRYYRDEPILSSLTVLFQSFPYQMMVWGVLALLYWIYKRNFRKAGVLLLPLVGMLFYISITALTTEKIYFLKPFSDIYISFNLIKPGYIFPLLLILLLWIVKRWLGFSAKKISYFSIHIIILSILISVFFKTYTFFTLPDSFSKNSNILITPTDHLLVNWNAIELNGRDYYVSTFRFLYGWNTDVKKYPLSNDYELLQSILIYPDILAYYSSSFQVPVVKTSVKNENLLVEIRELSPLSDIFWMNRLTLERNRTGHVLQLNKNYKTFAQPLDL